jgi:exopolysaccharide biosynthesis polyprenyl glycosylphosphotransferase
LIRLVLPRTRRGSDAAAGPERGGSAVDLELAGSEGKHSSAGDLGELSANAPRVIDLTDRVVESSRLRLAEPPERLERRPSGYRVRTLWERRLAFLVLIVDLAAILVSCLVALGVRFSDNGSHPGAVHYAVITAVLTALWVTTMSLSRAYESRFLGVGSEEFKRVFNAAVRVIAIIATISYATNYTTGRRYVVIALPLATVLDIAARYGVRKALVHLRRNGRCVHRVVVAGAPEGVADLIRHARRAPYAGMQVVGCCIEQRGPVPVRAVESVPVIGDLLHIPEALRDTKATTVAVTSRGAFSPNDLRRLSWQLEGTGIDMLVAPALTDIAGPRINIRPVAGLPLLHVEEPELSGGRRLLKASFDRSIALIALILLAPTLAMLALAIRLNSPGPVLFRQTRVGRGGREFTIYKFRSMFTDAEAQLEALLPMNERAEGLLFKIRKDPRVTPVGRWLRRYSLDELPQLLNVVKGDMSLVGPRPPLPSEVARYESDVRRRLLVKPGLTGLWQVSGRSDLSGEESVRLDLEYVENWSLALDFMILWKTVFAVVRGSGAY